MQHSKVDLYQLVYSSTASKICIRTNQVSNLAIDVKVDREQAETKQKTLTKLGLRNLAPLLPEMTEMVMVLLPATSLSAGILTV